MSWELNSNEPIYLQILKEIELQIVTGKYSPGSQLPGVRLWAQEAAVNPNTMQKALQELEKKKLVYTKRTSGRFVTDDKKIIDEIKLQLAKDYISNFWEGMDKLGIEREEAYYLLKSK